MSEVLNCIWALLAVGALIQWLCRSSHVAFRPQLPGLICVVALLFPVISLNDDLLQQQLLVAPECPVLKALLKADAASHQVMPMIGAGLQSPSPTRAVQDVLCNDGRVFVFSACSTATGDRSPPPLL